MWVTLLKQFRNELKTRLSCLSTERGNSEENTRRGKTILHFPPPPPTSSLLLIHNNPSNAAHTSAANYSIITERCDTVRIQTETVRNRKRLYTFCSCFCRNSSVKAFIRSRAETCPPAWRSLLYPPIFRMPVKYLKVHFVFGCLLWC